MYLKILKTLVKFTNFIGDVSVLVRPGLKIELNLSSSQNIKKIIIFADHLRGGGAERITVDLAHSLHLNGIHVELFVLDSSQQRIEVPPGIKVIRPEDEYLFKDINFHSSYVPSGAVDFINKFLLSSNPDLVILNWLSPHILQGKISHNNIYHWIHGDFFCFRSPSSFSDIFYWLKDAAYSIKKCKLVFNGANLIFVDKSLKDQWFFWATNMKYIEIPNGLSMKFSQDVSKKEYDVAVISRLSQEKQVSHAIQAFSIANLSGRMVIVGDGEEMHELKNLAKELNLDAKIDFVGWQSNPVFYIKKSKCVVVTSKSEGFCLVLFEALMQSVPVITYDCGQAIRKVMTEMNAKDYLVQRGDIKGMALKMQALLIKPYKIKREVIERYSINTMTNSFMLLGVK